MLGDGLGRDGIATGADEKSALVPKKAGDLDQVLTAQSHGQAIPQSGFLPMDLHAHGFGQVPLERGDRIVADHEGNFT